jgi:dethiobiotin synthetase
VTAIFVTATGAGVGKTFAIASLIRHFRQMGRMVEAIKPIVTGYDPANVAASNPGIFITTLEMPFSPDSVDRISPWRFRTALSPDLAASREGRNIDFDAVVAFCQNAVTQRRDILLIEGACGVMAPLDERRTILDVMMALRLPLILVTGSYPSAVSHALTAIDSLFRRDMNVISTIVCDTPSSTAALGEIVASIGRFTDPVIGLPRIRSS